MYFYSSESSCDLAGVPRRLKKDVNSLTTTWQEFFRPIEKNNPQNAQRAIAGTVLFMLRGAFTMSRNDIGSSDMTTQHLFGSPFI